jgi:hypothetical protein
MPQLHALQPARHQEDPHGDEGRSNARNEEKDQKAPEDLIKDAAKGVVDPMRRRPLIELGVKTNRRDEE